MFSYRNVLILFLLRILTPNYGQIAFTEVGVQYKVEHSLGNPTIGSGVSLFDFNQDGLDDLTLGTHRNKQIGFYVNNGRGFDLIDPLVDNNEIVKQITWVDYDNDGDPDLYIAANEGVSRLYLNEGGLVLKDVTEESGLPVNFHYGYGACWGDYNRDGWLDLYYVSKGVIGDPDAIRSYNRLFENNGDGTFLERTDKSGASDEGKLPFCAAFTDYNNDMWPDIYIANDKLTYNTLLKNKGNGIFEDVSVVTGSDARMNAMCVNPGDIDRDGWMDIYVTNTPVGSQCLKNGGEPVLGGEFIFTNIAAEMGIDFVGGNCWGSNFLDADNDGDLDLYVSSSLPVPKEISSAFYENINGEGFETPFIDGFQSDTSSSYTNAIGDLNNDGLIDIVVENNPPYNFFLWENQSENSNNWIKVHLEGVLSNRDGVGVKIETYANQLYQLQFTLCGSGFLGQNSSYKHFGLGVNNLLDSLIVSWPSGHIDKFFSVEVNQIFQIREGDSTEGVISVSNDVSIVNRPELTTSTNDFNHTESSLSLYPNPGSEIVFFESLFDLRKVKIFDSYGELVFSKSEGADIDSIDLSTLIPGIYFLQILTDYQIPLTKKWVKL